MIMEKHILNVTVGWTENNFSCVWNDDNGGCVICTHKTLEGLKNDFEETLQWHIETCVEDGDILPDYLIKGNYECNYILTTPALLHEASRYTTLEAIGHASGINPKQLSHYVTGVKKPRPYQRERIIAGLHTIAATFMAMQ